MRGRNGGEEMEGGGARPQIFCRRGVLVSVGTIGR